MRYWHKPVSVDAVQYDGENIDELREFVRHPNPLKTCRVLQSATTTPVLVERSDGNIYVVDIGDWIIKRDSGCIYSCTSESFRTNYEPAEV